MASRFIDWVSPSGLAKDSRRPNLSCKCVLASIGLGGAGQLSGGIVAEAGNAAGGIGLGENVAFRIVGVVDAGPLFIRQVQQMADGVVGSRNGLAGGVGGGRPPAFHIVGVHRLVAEWVADGSQLAGGTVGEVEDSPLLVGYGHALAVVVIPVGDSRSDRKSTRLNSSHLGISYAVF